MATAQTQFYKLAGDITIVLQQNRIRGDDADVIVNLTYTNLELADRCSLTNHIHEETLREIQQECKSKAPANLELGEFVVTNVGTGFDKCYIYHCACWMEGVDCKITFSTFIDCLSECFDTADSMGQTSILVPVIGVDAFERHESEGMIELAQLIVQTYFSLATNSKFSTKQLILGVDKDTFETFRTVLEDLSGQESRFEKDYSDKETNSPIHKHTDERASASVMDESMAFDNAHFNMQVLPQSDAKAKGARPKQINNKNGKNLRTADTEANRNRTENQIKALSGSGTTVKLYKGDITCVPVKAVVHGACGISKSVDMTDAVGQALGKAGGPVFIQECKFIGTKSEPLAFAVTSAGDMDYALIMHVNTSACTSDVDWQALIRGCLDEADKRNIKTLALPGLNGVFSKPRHQASNFGVVIKEYIHSGRGGIEEIHIVLPDDATYSIYNTILGGIPELPAMKPKQVCPLQNTSPDFTVTYRGVNIVVKEGDIADETIECIVHAYKVSSRLSTKITLNDKVGIALERKAGVSFKEECTKAGPCIWDGASIITPGGANFNTVLHIDTSLYKMYKKPTWDSFIYRCLQRAEENRSYSIAFPLIGLFAPANLEKLTDFQISGLEKYISGKQSNIMEVRFVIYNDTSVVQAFKDSIKSIIGFDNLKGAGPVMMDHTVTLPSGKGELDITIVHGDLTKETTECIVHATQNPISFGGQSGSALRAAGGKEFEQACAVATFSRFKNTVITSAGRLPCKWVLHLDMQNYEYANKNKLLTNRIQECLNTANDAGIASMAFPALGTGVLGLKPAEISKCFRTAIDQFNNSRKTPWLNYIRLVVFQQSMVEEFKTKLTFK